MVRYGSRLGDLEKKLVSAYREAVSCLHLLVILLARSLEHNSDYRRSLGR